VVLTLPPSATTDVNLSDVKRPVELPAKLLTYVLAFSMVVSKLFKITCEAVVNLVLFLESMVASIKSNKDVKYGLVVVLKPPVVLTPWN